MIDPVPAEYVPVRHPAQPVGFTTAPPALQPLRWDQPRGQRVRGSSVTFGPLGRSVVTAVILMFAAWIAFTNLFFVIPALPAVAQGAGATSAAADRGGRRCARPARTPRPGRRVRPARAASRGYDVGVTRVTGFPA